jgi:hypothetical protein
MRTHTDLAAARADADARVIAERQRKPGIICPIKI